MAGLLELLAIGRGAAVLPDDGRRQRPAAAPVPEDDGLALVGDADGGDPVRAARLLDQRAGRGAGQLPDFLRILLDPAGLREPAVEFMLGEAEALAAGVEQHGARARRAFVDDQQPIAHAPAFLPAS